MAAPRKYPEELRERAVRMAVDLRRDPATRTGALRRVGEQLGINPETLRNWVTQAEIDGGDRPGSIRRDQIGRQRRPVVLVIPQRSGRPAGPERHRFQRRRVGGEHGQDRGEKHR